MIQIIVIGLIAVLEALSIKNLLIAKQSSISEEYKNIINIVNKKKINVIFLKKGDKIDLKNGEYIDILHPTEDLLNDGKGGLNINSITAKFVSQNFSILFTGDIEKDAERILVNTYKDKLKADILKIAHHGSKTSTTEEFLECVNPKIALIGVGKNNTFGHPTEEVLERLKNRKIQIYRTDLDGEITIQINENYKYKIETKLFNNE